MIQIIGHPSITEGSMVLPFQDDNLSIEYSQFRQNGLLKKIKIKIKKNKKKRQNEFVILFLFKYHFFFSKNNTYSCYMVGKDVFVFCK